MIDVLITFSEDSFFFRVFFTVVYNQIPLYSWIIIRSLNLPEVENLVNLAMSVCFPFLLLFLLWGTLIFLFYLVGKFRSVLGFHCFPRFSSVLASLTMLPCEKFSNLLFFYAFR